MFRTRSMLDFTEEQKLAGSAIRAWCAQHLEPKVLALEAGTLELVPLMRELGSTFGLATMARAAFAKAGAAETEGGLITVLMLELSRVCPGFAMSFGASLGLFGGAVMSRGTPLQKQKWALPVLMLEKIGCWALTEPGAGSDAFGS